MQKELRFARNNSIKWKDSPLCRGTAVSRTAAMWDLASTLPAPSKVFEVFPIWRHADSSHPPPRPLKRVRGYSYLATCRTSPPLSLKIGHIEFILPKDAKCSETYATIISRLKKYIVQQNFHFKFLGLKNFLDNWFCSGFVQTRICIRFRISQFFTGKYLYWHDLSSSVAWISETQFQKSSGSWLLTSSYMKI